MPDLDAKADPIVIWPIVYKAPPRPRADGPPLDEVARRPRPRRAPTGGISSVSPAAALAAHRAPPEAEASPSSDDEVACAV